MKKYIFLIIVVIVSLSSQAMAAITSVTLTAASPTTMSNGRTYYCAGRIAAGDYTFRIQANDPAATGKAYWSNAAQHTILVAFPGGSNFWVDLNSPGADASGGNNITVISATDNSGGAGPYTTIDYTVVVRFNWNAAPVAAAGNTITATVTASNGTTTNNTTRTFNFGVISQIAVLNFSQSGDAADTYVNPWHDAFNVTGRIVYYSAVDGVMTTQVNLAEISGLTLYRSGIAAGATVVFSGALNDFQYAVPASYFAFGAITAAAATTGAYTWSITAAMSTGAATEPSSSGTLVVNVGMVSVNPGGLIFVNGGGRDAPPYNVRSVNVSGTQLQLTTTAAMNGTVTFVINDGTNNYNLQVVNGAATGTVLISPYPAVGGGVNTPVNYTVASVSGGVYGNTTAGAGQNSSALILNSTGYTCRWENTHWPGHDNVPAFTSLVGVVTSTATSFRLQWTALSTAAPSYDYDFDTYRVYYRTGGATPGSWLMLDRTNTAALGVIGAGTVILDVGGPANPLAPLTAYDYRISAVDVFGNEVPLASQISGSVTTAAVTVEATVSDGISTFNNTFFNVTAPAITTDPALRVVRKTAIKVSLYIVTAGPAPEQVNLIVANNDSDVPATQFGVSGTNDDILTLANGAGRWSVPCMKVAPNTYEALISSEHPVMAMGANARFIVETVIGGVTAYYDHTPDAAPPGNWWNDEWRFRVSQPVNFFPWPTRVLNNVLTSTMPCCFPAYYLTIDSLVTIKVYDVKGRVIMVLAENLYRPGGQNIKDNGWCGTNKDNRRVGPGLYYIHIKATTFGNKVTLDKILKVVVAH